MAPATTTVGADDVSSALATVDEVKVGNSSRAEDVSSDEDKIDRRVSNAALLLVVVMSASNDSSFR